MIFAVFAADFDKSGRNYCDECYEKDKVEYKAVRDYVIQHKGCTVMEVSTITGISVKTIYRYINEGRIEIDEKSHNKLIRPID